MTTYFNPVRSIARETIKQTKNEQTGLTDYEWTCPGCESTVHGDSKKDTIFEIRHDALCVYCRVRVGEMRLNGSNFVHVPIPERAGAS